MADDSTTTVRATFETREAPDLAVEHLVQQHGVPRSDILIRSASDRNAMMASDGLWRHGNANQPPSFLMLTIAPGPDVAPIYDRQIVVMAPERSADWMYLSKPEHEVLAPLPAGSFLVEQVRAGSG